MLNLTATVVGLFHGAWSCKDGLNLNMTPQDFYQQY